MSVHHELANSIESGDTASVKRIIQENPGLVNSQDWTPPPLHCAVLWNQPLVAEILLDHGADLEIRDPDRETTPLQYATLYCKKDMIRLLVSRGARANFTRDGGSDVLQLAIRGTQGEFEEFDDLPTPTQYEAIVNLLKELDIT